MSKKLTKKQLKANRKNAQKSTGPKTPEGKAATAKNAIKHGLLSKCVVLNPQYESQAEYDDLLADLQDDLQPQGPIQQALTERIASCYWRLRRAQLYETGCIEFNLSNIDNLQPENETRNKLEQQLSDLDTALAHQQSLLESLDPNDTSTYLTAHRPALDRATASRGLEPCPNPRLVGLFEELTLAAVGRPDPATEYEKMKEHTESSYIEYLQEQGLTGHKLHEAIKQAQQTILEETRAQQNQIQIQLRNLDRAEQQRRNQAALTANLPEEKALKQLIRYESMLDRQLHRALHELRQQQKHSQRCLARFSDTASAGPATTTNHCDHSRPATKKNVPDTLSAPATSARTVPQASVYGGGQAADVHSSTLNSLLSNQDSPSARPPNPTTPTLPEVQLPERLSEAAEGGVGEADTDSCVFAAGESASGGSPDSFSQTNPFAGESTPNSFNHGDLDTPTNDAAVLLNAHKTGPTLFPKDQPGLTITIQPPKQEQKQPA